MVIILRIPDLIIPTIALTAFVLITALIKTWKALFWKAEL
jgi:hypothetical protein